MRDKWKELWRQKGGLIGKGVALVAVVAGMAAAIVQAYSGSGIFKPDQFDPTELQENRVVFQDDRDTKAKDDKASGKSDTWDKDQSIQDKLDKSELPDSSALFEHKNLGQKGKKNNYAQNKGSDKMMVNTSGDNGDDSQGTIKVPTGNGNDNGNRPSDDGDAGQSDGGTQQGDGNSDNQGTGDGENPTTTTPVTTEPGGHGDHTDTDDGNKGSDPEQTPAATKKPRPNPPEKDTGLPPGDSLYENMFNIKDYPESGVPDSAGAMHLNIIPIFSFDYQSNIYYDAQITADKLLKSVLIYVMDDNKQIRYRLKKYDANFYVSDYPSIATEDFTAVFHYRQNSGAEWQTTEYTFTVSLYKFFVLDDDENLIGDVTPNLDTNPNGNVFNLLPYYEKLLTAKQQEQLKKNGVLDLQQYIPGWIDEEDNELTSDQYTAEQYGWKSFSPQTSSRVPYGYTIQMKWHVDLNDFNHPSNLKYLQTLTEIPNGIKDLEIMQGIHWVDLQDARLRSLKLSSTVAAINYDGVIVGSKYEVPEDNPYFSEKDSMLWNKDQTKLLAIPTSVDQLDLDEKVTSVNLRDKCGIYKITLHSETPPEIDLSKLSNAIIWVPEEAYDVYLAQWKDQLPDTVKLYADGEDEDKVVRNHAVMSSDGKILYRVLDEVVGTYEVPNGVEVIKENAMSQLTRLHTVILPSTMKAMERGGLSASSIQRIILLAKDAPVLMRGFERQLRETTTGELYIPKDAAYNATTWGKWKVITADIKMESNKGFRYVSLDDYRILLSVPDDLKVFNEQSQDQKIDEIAPGAFCGNTNLMVAELSDGISKIGSYAFWKCTNLQQIFLHEKKELTIMDHAFDEADKLRAIVSEAKTAEFCDDYKPKYTLFHMEGATGYPDVDDGMGHKSMIVPKTITGFESEKQGDDVFLMYGVGKIADRTYSTLINVTDTVQGKIKLRDDVEIIEYYAFAKCKGLTSFDFAAYPHLNILGPYAFAESGLSGTLKLTDQLLELDDRTFYGCAGLKEIQIGAGLNELPAEVFEGCDGVKKVVFAKDGSITTIHDLAFAFMSQLTEIAIPASVERLYVNVFAYCSGLKQIIFLGEEAPKLIKNEGIEFFKFGVEQYKHTKMTVPEGCEDRYISKWKEMFEKNEQGLTGEEMVKNYLGISDQQ